MRPGHFCPGNYEAQSERQSIDIASMRPGHFCPGNCAIEAMIDDLRNALQ